jgi:flagellar hook protein FlgE
MAPANGRVALPAYTPPTGAAPMAVTLDVGNSTQYGNAFSVSALVQDGYATGQLTGIEVSSEGIVNARYTNGVSTPLGQVALTSFANPQGLQPVGDNGWAESFESGQARRGAAGTSDMGLVQGGALEASNVDLTEQLVNMISAQRNFQANAQMISTQDQITQTVINIR